MPNLPSERLVAIAMRMGLLLGLAGCGGGGEVGPPGGDAGRADGGDAGRPSDGSGPADARDGGGPPTLQGFFPGTNLSGAEFGSDRLPGVLGTDYIYPPHSDVDYFAGKGFRMLRIPFLWERMQPTLDQALDPAQLALLQDLVTYATSRGAYALIDPHNYARYRGAVVGSTGAGAPTSAQFGSFWGRLAPVFATDPRVVFGLMNEPHDMATELWLADANAAIAAIRAAGASNVIFVPGNAWTGAHSWTDNYYGTPNSTVMLGVQDPIHNVIYEVHQYFDADFSGTHPDCTSTTIGSQSLAAFTQWMKDHSVRGFLGEFGSADNPTCAAALDDMLSFIDRNRDVWVGWTWWAAGPWWGNYMFSIEPANGQDKPQLATLLRHL